MHHKDICQECGGYLCTKDHDGGYVKRTEVRGADGELIVLPESPLEIVRACTNHLKLIRACEEAASIIRKHGKLTDELVEAHNILDQAATKARAEGR